MGQALEMCVHCENKRGCDMCADLHEWIMEHVEMECELEAYRDAEHEGRIRILSQSESGTCGSCGHFNRMPGRRCGTCEVRSCWTNRRGQIEEHRGTFTPSQSRKACKQYAPREEAEAALAGEGGDEG